MALLKFILYTTVILIFLAISYVIGYVIWNGMVNPPPYYEGRDWFDPDDMAHPFEWYAPVEVEIIKRDQVINIK